MKCKVELQRYAQTGIGLIEYRSSRQPVGHIGTGPDILAVFIGTLVFVVNAVRSTCKPGVVAGTHIVTGSGNLQSVTDFGMCSAAKANCIGTYRSQHVTAVVKAHHTLRTLAFAEVESAQIDPCSAAYALVYAECGRSARMEHNVSGIVHACGVRLIGYVNGIITVLRYVRNPECG